MFLPFSKLKADVLFWSSSSTYEQFIQDVDGNGTTLTRFMKKAAIRAKLHGVEFIVVDMEQLEEGQIVTEKDIFKYAKH